LSTICRTFKNPPTYPPAKLEAITSIANLPPQIAIALNNWIALIECHSNANTIEFESFKYSTIPYQSFSTSAPYDKNPENTKVTLVEDSLLGERFLKIHERISFFL